MPLLVGVALKAVVRDTGVLDLYDVDDVLTLAEADEEIVGFDVAVNKRLGVDVPGRGKGGRGVSRRAW